MSETFNVPAPLESQTGGGVGTLAFTGEAKVHGLVGAQFGDLEFDAGKSVRWFQWFVDDLFIVDVNSGDQRYWVINWAASFPDSEHIVTGRIFFDDAPVWRKEQFEAASKAFNYQDEDWVLFLDAHEGLSFDIRSLPDDYNAQPFRSWVWREITRLEDANETIGHLPFFVYLNYSDLQNITYSTPANDGGSELGIPAVQQAVSVPWYLPHQHLARLIKVETLRDPDFDWTILDTPVATPSVTGAKAQVISYGYAHWNRLDVEPGETEPPPLSAENDDGWRMRNLISKVRPIPGIPIGTTWQDPSTDPATVPGPWCVDAVAVSDPTLSGTVEEIGHAAPAAAAAGVRVPLYDTVMRLNLRDGLWYERGVSGNVPLSWDAVNEVWVPRYSPDQWPERGIDADGLPEPPPSMMSLRLDGAAGSYAFTTDSPYLDYAYGFTLMAIVALDDWQPPTPDVLVSKWDNGDQCSYLWMVESDGLRLRTSRDGTAANAFDHKLVLDLGVADGEPTAIAVSFSTDIILLEDQVRFWQWDGTDWVMFPDVLVTPNPDYLPIFNSFSAIMIGAYNENQGNAAGLFRAISIREGVGQDNALGGVEQALMRGDITTNPSYDRYGNVWTNQGGWSYVEMTDPPTPRMMRL